MYRCFKALHDVSTCQIVSSPTPHMLHVASSIYPHFFLSAFVTHSPNESFRKRLFSSGVRLLELMKYDVWVIVFPLILPTIPWILLLIHSSLYLFSCVFLSSLEMVLGFKTSPL
eukprot:Phypoly_transcript_10658.p2 GENE.Phypoly_transcript_10658~~Phypoly_transcript_10658.p2  ORF type:complete len:114 (+),score=6.09 Phypoly_transcript_10658:639-980(+)